VSAAQTHALAVRLTTTDLSNEKRLLARVTYLRQIIT